MSSNQILSHYIATVTLLGIFVGTFLFATPVFAVVYQPGETLNPACAPTDSNCYVLPPLTATTTGAYVIGDPVSGAALAVSTTSSQYLLWVGTSSPVFTVMATTSTAHTGLSLSSFTPSAIANTLYNIAGTLYWNGSALGLAGGGLETLNGISTTSQTLAVGSSGTDFGIVSSVSTHTFNIPTSSATARGLLSSADWATFNTKVSTTRQVLSGTGLAGGGDLSADRTLTLDINSLASDGTTNSADQLALYDADTGTVRKMARSTFLAPVTGALTYQGQWNANTNTPTLSDGTGAQGRYYVVSVAGTQNLGSGNIVFNIGDWLVHNGTVWEKLNNSVSVSSVFGRTGGVIASNGDYTATQITNTAAGTISATTVQAALNELDTEKLATALANGSLWIGNGSGAAVAVALSGDATVTNAGVLTIGAGAITSGKIFDGAIVDADVNTSAAIALSKLASGSSIVTSLATPSGSNASGGAIASNVLTLSLADGTNPGLVSTGTQTIAGAKTFSSAPTLSSMTAGSLLFAGTGGLISQNNANLFWDNTNARLGIGTTTPSASVDIVAAGSANALTISGAIALKRGANFSTIGTSNDIDFGNTSLIRLTGGAAQTVTGIANGSDGKLLTIMNAGGNAATISNAHTGSVAANRILTGTGADLTLNADASILLAYDSGTSVWRVIGGSGGGGSSNTIQTLTATGSVSGWTSTVKVDATTASFTATLPTASGNSGKSVEVVKTDNTTNAVLVAPFAGQTIGASSTGIYLYSQGDSVVLRSDGTNIQLVADNRSSVGQSKSYMKVTRSTSAQSVTVGNDILFNNTEASFGSDISYNSGTGVFTLKAGKTYRMEGVLRKDGANGSGYINYGWRNQTTSTDIGTAAEASSPSYGTDYGDQEQASVVITPSVDTNISLRVFGANNGLVLTGGSYAYVEVISTPQNVINTVDTYQQALTANVNANSTAYVNTGLSVSLIAGKTYEIAAVLSGYVNTGNNADDYMYARLFNVTSGAEIPQTETIVTSGRSETGGFKPGSGSGTIIKQYTPSVNTTIRVEVRMTATSGVSTAELYGGTAGRSYLTVKQLGSTASTGLALNNILGAMAAGSLDNANYVQVWNWSTATTTATTTGLFSLSGNSLVSGNLLHLNTASASSTALALKVNGATAFQYGSDFATTTAYAHNVDFGNTSSVRVNAASAAFQGITGITGGDDGRIITLVNASSTAAFTLFNATTSSAVANRIITGTGADLTIAADASVLLSYDPTAARWRVIGGSGGGSSQTTFATQSSSQTLPASTFGTTQKLNAASGNLTITLPTAVGQSGKFIEFVKTDNSANSARLVGTGSEQIASTTSLFLYSQNDAVTVRSDGANWQVVSDNRGSVGQSKSYLRGRPGASPQTVSAVGDLTLTQTNAFGSDISVSSNQITLTTGKTYRLTANIFADFAASTDGMTVEWVDSTNTTLPNSTASLNRPLTNGNNQGQTQFAESIITPTSDTVVKLRAVSVNGTASIYNNLSDFYVEVISTPQNVINTVEYVSARGDNDTWSSGAAISLATLTGNIPNTNGVFTLTAGKTYHLRGSIRFAHTAQAIQYQWRDIGSSSLIGTGAYQFADDQTDHQYSPQPIAEAIFTPTTNTTVRLENKMGLGLTIVSSESWATITQVGSTGSTGVTLNSLLGAIAAGTLDSANFVQTWNWSTLTTGNGMTMAANALTTGSILSITSSNASLNSTNGLLYVANTDGSTNGTVARIQSNSTAGSGLTVLANGNVGIGTSSPASVLHVQGTGIFGYSGADVFSAALTLRKDRAGAIVQNGDELGYMTFNGYDGAAYQRAALILAIADGTPGANDMPGRLSFYTTPDGSATSLERMRINNAGYIGIGTTSPRSRLEVYDSVESSGWAGRGIFGGITAAVVAGQSNSIATIGGHNAALSSWGSLAINPGGGNVSIRTTTMSHALRVAGIVCLDIDADGVCNDNTSALSDARLKENVSPIGGIAGLDLINKLNPVTFTWTGENYTGTSSSLGFIAQEVEQLFPGLDLVVTDQDGYRHLDYGKLVAVTVAGIQELGAITLGSSTHALSLATSTFPDGLVPALASLADAEAARTDHAGNKTFFGRFLDRLTQWFADATNGIAKFFAEEVRTKKLCIGETCLTEEELKALMVGRATSAPNETGSQNSQSSTQEEVSEIGEEEEETNPSQEGNTPHEVDVEGNSVPPVESETGETDATVSEELPTESAPLHSEETAPADESSVEVPDEPSTETSEPPGEFEAPQL